MCVCVCVCVLAHLHVCGAHFLYPFVCGGHLGRFYISVSVAGTAVTSAVQISLPDISKPSLVISPEVELLDHTAVPLFIF